MGSKASLKKSEVHGDAVFPGGITSLFDDLVSGWKRGESRTVKSINFDTPTGVPEVVFVETPLEKLRRAYTEWDKSVNLCDQKSSIIDACGKFDMFLKEFLASAEREGV